MDIIAASLDLSGDFTGPIIPLIFDALAGMEGEPLGISRFSGFQGCSRRQCRFDHLSERCLIIVGYPLKKVDVLLMPERFRVKRSRN